MTTKQITIDYQHSIQDEMVLTRVLIPRDSYCESGKCYAVESMLCSLTWAEGQGISMGSLCLHTATFHAGSMAQRAKMLLLHQGSETRQILSLAESLGLKGKRVKL